MASGHRLCAGCLCNDEHNTAESWCVECQEDLCKTCSKTHNRLQPTHMVIQLSVTDVLSSGLCSTNCPNHLNRNVTLYCTCHDVIICDSCLGKDHQNCEDVLPLDKAAKNVKGSFCFEDVQSRMRNLSAVLSKVKDTQTMHFNELDLKQQEEKIIKDISEMKEAIIEKLNRAEKKSIHTIRNEFKSLKEKGKGLISELSSHRKFVVECMKNIAELEKSASEPQLFQAVKMMDKRTHEIESRVQSELSKTSHIEFQFITGADKIRTSFDLFGRIVSSYKEIELPMLKQVQVPKPISDDRKFRLLHKFPTFYLKPGEKIQRGCIAGDKLLLPSFERSFLYVCNHDGTDVKCIKLKSSPYDVGIIDTKRAIVTMKDKGDHLFDTESLTVSDLKKTVCCYGVSCNNGQIYANGVGQVLVFNEKGDIQKSFKTMKRPYYIHISSTGKFYYTTALADEICQVTSSGESVFFQHPEVKDPQGMATDGSGNLYVYVRSSQNILKISENDKSHGIVLSKNDGVRHAYGMHFDIVLQRLLILNNEGTEVLVFQLG